MHVGFPSGYRQIKLKLMTASYMIISITYKDGVMLRLVFTTHPASQAGRAKLLIKVLGHQSCGASEPMASASKSFQRLAQLAICHTTEIVFKCVLMFEACVCCRLRSAVLPHVY